MHSPNNNNITTDPNTTQDATAFILPLIVFLVIANFYPEFSSPDESLGGSLESESDAAASPAVFRYVVMIGAQVVIATGLFAYFYRTYRRHFPMTFSPLSVAVGIVGAVLWIGICELHLEKSILESMGWGAWAAARPAFNPFESLADPGFRNVFLAIRFALLVLLVPVVEELFLRGWLVRWVENPNWEAIHLKALSWGALVTPSVYGVLTHPGEAIAAFLWFGLVTWLMHRTGSLWDCIVAHAVTNLLLGIYVVLYARWYLW